MYRDATTVAKINGKFRSFRAKVVAYHGSVFSSLLFIIMLETLFQKLREGLPLE